MQKVILDLLPGGVAPIVYASQYDDGRSIRFMLTEGGPDSQYSLNSSDVITCNLTKPDGTETVINVANPGGGEHYVDLVNGADDYDQAGAYLGEIVLTRKTKVIGSANFVLKVEEDAYGGQITTASATGNPCTFTTDLADALVSLTAEIVASGGGGTPDNPIPINGYTEANITRCGVNLFDKTATDVSNGYIANSYIRNNGTIISDVDCNVSEYIRVGGDTEITLKPLMFSSPSLCFYDSNKNFISGENYNSRATVTTTTPSNCAFIRFSIIKANIDTTQLELGSSSSAYHAYNGQTYAIAFGQTVYGGVLDVTRGKLTVTWGSVDLGSLNYTNMETSDKGFYTENQTMKNNIMCSIYSVVSGSDIYNGTAIDKSIGLTSSGTSYRIRIKDTSFSANTVGANALKASLNGIYLVYELATPFDIDLTPVQISALVGTNNITSDLGGDVSVTYIKKV